MSRLAKQLQWFCYFIPTCSVLNYVRIALTMVDSDHCASNVRFSLFDIYMSIRYIYKERERKRERERERDLPN